MQLKTLLDALEEIAPVGGAEPWDNVGLLTGDPLQTISRVMLAIDYTAAVADEARNLNCDCIIAYHPPIFSALKRLVADGAGSLIHDAIRRGVAIYSPHTAWDTAADGTNDFLADCLRLTGVRPLRSIAASPQNLKLVTFIPAPSVEKVASALFDAGAGRIGSYTSCSFRSPGVGTFFGQPGTAPAVGSAGQLESQPEIRLETLVPIAKLNAVIEALRASHPYEEPAYDLLTLAPGPSDVGAGRIGELPDAIAAAAVIARLKDGLKLTTVLFAGDESRPIRRIAICAGAGGELLDTAIDVGADLFLTGELRHHDALKAQRRGVAVICTLHSNCERPTLMRLKTRLEQRLPPPGLPLILSQADRDPFLFR